MALPVIIQPKQTYFFDEAYTQPPAVITQNTNLTKIASIRCRTGLKPYLTLYAQQIDSGAVNFVTWHLYRNGNPFYPYHAHQNQTSSPQDNVKLPVPIPLEQDDLIEVFVDLGAAGAGNFLAIARILIEYFDFTN